MYQEITINLNENKYSNWRSSLNNLLKENQSTFIQLNCASRCLSCSEILSIIEMAQKWDCTIINFWSTSQETIVSAKALGYQSELIFEKYSTREIDQIDNKLASLETYFHKGTVRSGQYIESQGDLLILGDVNPGAMVKAVGNIMIWGRLLGTAHAGVEGDSKAKISALQLRPVQLRIANKIARGPKEKPQIGLAEQATIESENIVISPLESL